jgi:putative transposase
VADASPIAVTRVGSPPGQKGFAVQPRRWGVERSFAWSGQRRRLARDHEATTSAAATFFTLAAAMLLVRRLAPPLCSGL